MSFPGERADEAIDELNGQIEDLEAENTQLRAENARLREQRDAMTWALWDGHLEHTLDAGRACRDDAALAKGCPEAVANAVRDVWGEEPAK